MFVQYDNKIYKFKLLIKNLILYWQKIPNWSKIRKKFDSLKSVKNAQHTKYKQILQFLSLVNVLGSVKIVLSQTQKERFTLSSEMFVLFKCLWTKVKMATKKRECHVSRWTKEEVEKFDKALANHVNGFVFCLDRIALKK